MEEKDGLIIFFRYIMANISFYMDMFCILFNNVYRTYNV